MSTQGATGHLEVAFELRNSSTSACTLYGYPGARLFDAVERPLRTHVLRGNGFFPDTLLVPRQVVVQPGGGARFGLSFSVNSEYGGGRPCLTAASLASVPPNAHQPLRVALGGRGRPRFAPCGGQLVVSPVYEG